MALEKYIREITDILKREIRSFNTILELLILEEKSLVECDSQALAEVLERQEDVFSSIACLEKSRMDILVKISEETGEDPDAYTVSRLAESMDDSLKKELLDAGHILVGLNEDIQRKKATNTMLINQSILLCESDIRLILNAVNNHENQEAGYTPQAESNGSSQGVCIDEKI